MKKTAYSGNEPVTGEIIRTAERAILKGEGDTGMRARIRRLVKRYRMEFAGNTLFVAVSAGLERNRLRERMDGLMLKNAPDEWLARIWSEIYALDMAAEMLLRQDESRREAEKMA